MNKPACVVVLLIDAFETNRACYIALAVGKHHNAFGDLALDN